MMRYSFLVTAGTSAGVMALSLLTSVLAARLLGPAGRGQLSSIQTVPLVVAGIASFGFPSAVGYLSARQPQRARTILAAGAVASLAVGLAVGAVAWVLMPRILPQLGGETVAFARWYLAIIPIYVATGLPAAVVHSQRRFGAWNFLRVLPTTLWLLTIIGCWVASQRSAGRLALTYLAVQAVLSPLSVLLSWHGSVRSSTDFRRDLKGVLAYAAPIGIGNIPAIWNSRVDQIFLANIVSPQSLGQYVITIGWVGMAGSILAAVGSVLFPHLAAEANAEKQAASLARAVRGAIAVSCLMIVGLSLTSPILLPMFFGNRYSGNGILAFVLAISTCLGGVCGVLEEGLRGAGHPRAPAISQWVAVPLATGAHALLIPAMGTLGAALASVGAGLVILIQLVYWARRQVGIRPRSFIPGFQDFSSLWVLARSFVKRRAPEVGMG
jgi:enterobacterial common antigen flippase